MPNKFLLIIITLILNINLQAAERGVHATKNIIGQDYYLKRCSSCHGEGNRGGNMASIREWKKIFSNEAEELLDFHIEEKDTQNLSKYIKSKEFKNESKLMLQFLQEFAYDSEYIPTCY